MEVDAGQAIEAQTRERPACLDELVTLSPVADGTPCAFVSALPPDYWHGAYVYSVDLQVILNGLYLAGPLVETGDGWVYGPTEATIVLVGAPCDTVASDPQTSVVQITCSMTYGGGP